MHVQTYSASVEELEVATVKALSRPAQPDKETMNEAHLRIGATVAASYQQNEIIAHRASVCSDAALASVLQEDVPPPPQVICGAIFSSVFLVCFVGYSFILFVSCDAGVYKRGDVHPRVLIHQDSRRRTFCRRGPTDARGGPVLLYTRPTDVRGGPGPTTAGNA